LRIAAGNSNSVMMSAHFRRHCLAIVGYFSSHFVANFSNASSASSTVADW
jgi:hypothetical protein